MNFFLIALCLIAGVVFRATGILPENAHKGINAWILYIALPAVSLLYIPAITWSTALILPVAMPLLVWSGSWLMMLSAAKRLAFDKATRAALLLTAGLGNTSFIGFPLTQAYLGDEGLRIAVICDQINFIALSIFGVATAIDASHRTDSTRKGIFRALFRFPPFSAFLAALILPRFVSFSPIEPLLTRLAETLVPLALFSVGLQIQFSTWKRELASLSFGLVYKLLIAPAVVLCAALGLGFRGVTAQASVFEAAMAPMVTAAILASEYQLNPQLSNLMVSIGTIVSLATTALWFLIIRAVL